MGHCVHRIAMHPDKPDTLFMQLHWNVMRTDNGGDLWKKVSGNLPTDFGFPIDVHAHEPETIYVVPIESDSLHYPPEGKLRVFRSRKGGNEWEPLTKGLPQKDCYVNVLREAMSVDTLDDCGVYFGTTGGQVYCSPNGGKTWEAIASNLPAVLSVEAQVIAGGSKVIQNPERKRAGKAPKSATKAVAAATKLRHAATKGKATKKAAAKRKK